MLRTTFAGVGATAAACRNSSARQAKSLRGVGDPRQWQASSALRCCGGGPRRWSSQEAEEKLTTAEAGESACGGPSSLGGHADAANTTAATTTTQARSEQEQQQQRTFLLRTSDSPSPQSHLKVAVPSTTAEAMAMNTSIKERAKRDAERAAAAAAAASPRSPLKFPTRGRKAPTEGKKPPPAAAAGARANVGEGLRAQSVMVVTPNARSKAIQMKVPRTTAECIELNKTIRERYPSEPPAKSGSAGDAGGAGTTTTTTNNNVNENYSRRWRNPPSPGVGSGSGRDARWGEAGASRSAYGGEGAGLSSPEMVGYAGQLGHGPGEEPDFERMIARLHGGMRWQQIVRVWEEIEEREKDGEVVKLGSPTYENLMSAFIAHLDLGVVARCGRVFDHLVASGQDIRPAMYNLYMKGCSVGKLGTRAVALIESLDRLPGKRYKPNPQFFYNLLSATSAQGMVAESKLYYGVMRDTGFAPNHSVFQNMLDMFIQEDRLVDALRIVEDTHHAGMKPRDALMNKLTYACMRQGEPELMHKTLDLLLLTGNIVNPMTVKNVLYMASRRRDDEMATKIWVAAQQWGHRFSQADYSFMVRTFFSVGKDDKALATLVQAYKEGIEVNRKTLTFCAQRLAVSNKRLDQAYYTLILLKEHGEPVPVEAVNAIVVGCAIRQAVDRCFATADALPVVFELSPNLDTYNALMHVLGSMRAQDTDNATLGIGMTLLDQMEEQEGVEPNQETFMSLVDLACMSDGLTEDFADSLVKRMTEKHGLRLEQDIVDTLASAFEDRGMHGLAQQWADKMPSLDDVVPAFDANTAPPFGSASLLPAEGAAAAGFTRQGESGVRARRVAQDRGRYTGFDDGRFKAQRHSTAAAGADRFSRMHAGGGGGYSGRGDFAGGSGGGGGGGDGEGFSREGGVRRESGGWAGEADGEGAARSGGGWAGRCDPVGGEEK